MKKVLTLLIAILATTITYAQIDLGAGNHRVVVTMKDGSTLEGITHRKESAPWSYMQEIKVFDESLLDAKKIKNKDKIKYKAKDVEFYTLDDGRKFAAHKTLMPTWNGDVGLKMLPQNFFLEVEMEGAITMLKGYSLPPSVASGVSYDEIYEAIRDEPNYFLIKDGKKITETSVVVVEKWINDADITSERWREGEFGNKAQKEGKKLGNFIRSTSASANMDILKLVVDAYNTEMSEG